MLPRMPRARVARRNDAADLVPGSPGRRADVIPRQCRTRLMLLVVEREIVLDFVEMFTGVFLRRFVTDSIRGRVMLITVLAPSVGLPRMIFAPVLFLGGGVDRNPSARSARRTSLLTRFVAHDFSSSNSSTLFRVTRDEWTSRSRAAAFSRTQSGLQIRRYLYEEFE